MGEITGEKEGGEYLRSENAAGKAVGSLGEWLPVRTEKRNGRER